MNGALLHTLGLDPGMPLDALIEALEEKELEYTEKADRCTDEDRRAELRRTQQAIRDLLERLRGGVTLQGKAEPETAEPEIAEPEIAEPETAPDPAERRRALFNAAHAGDGAAALALAGEYRGEGNPDSAQKWALTAHGLHTPGAGLLLMELLGKTKTGQSEILPLCLEELDWLTGYDRFALCEGVAQMLAQNKLSAETALAQLKPAVDKLPADAPERELLEELCRKTEERRQRAQEKAARDKANREAAQIDSARRASQKAAWEKSQARAAKKAGRKGSVRGLALILVCLLAPPLLAWAVNGAFWLLFGIGGEKGVSYAMVSMPILPTAAGALLRWGCWRLRGKGDSRLSMGAVYTLLLSAVINLGCFLLAAGIATLAGLEAILPVTVGPLNISAYNYYAFSTAAAFYILSLLGALGV